MTDPNTPFLPDWVSPPGETISDIAEERGWSQGELASVLSVYWAARPSSG